MERPPARSGSSTAAHHPGLFSGFHRKTPLLITLKRLMPTIARYSLDGPVLPLIQATLPLAEAARRALMSRYRTLNEIERYGRVDPPNAERFVSRVFSGKDEQGVPLSRSQSRPSLIYRLTKTMTDRLDRPDHVLHARGVSPRRGACPRRTAVVAVR